ncbi:MULTISPECIES: glycosyltransferase family 2 protein [Pontibacillus]|uniref:Glycosyltransferase family 2 protein n=1 Tax=Pontibacillus chungwhensis TaxID=265426 RepID=A0ABY8UUQ3_9BACI|nr:MULTISPECIES: glycosyltransferase family 2 protein [Pontibacillus]MCD5323779.1 glycosyltransferase family 2 protein [Pontibacillus sp. HN14]WIF97143.1 glycosyltransferase family 2 protein [Pontibacillus chungwhensis]
MKKVVVFLPAHNEEDCIKEMIHTIPRQMGENIEVKIILIDDGSKDNTIELAKEAGVDAIYRNETNQGLGAAVRQGLKRSLELGADIGVMIDADLEYPGRQIPDLIQPILNNQADYVMGSRFLGNIEGMKLHRRLGNYAFTFLQSLLLKRWIYDGQSGMRAFSKEVMQEAEIIHDYNYAQVVTLNIVRKGFRMKEIPIEYQVRKKGESFIKFKAYMSSVLPAIYREMKRHPSPVKKPGTNEEWT